MIIWKLLALLALLAWSDQARAFGGLWSSQSEPVRTTTQQILLVDRPDATLTAVIRLELSGPAQDFAWLIPVPAKASVAVSSNEVFRRLEAATSPEYWVDVAVEGSCVDRSSLLTGYENPDDAGAGALYPTDKGPVDVLEQGTVGPYEYVELAAAAGDPARAAREWLTQHGYRTDGVDPGALNPYLRQGQPLLAFKLKRGLDHSALRPVALTYAGERLALPILPVQGPDVRLVIWVVGAAQAVPENLPSLVLNDALIDWLSARRFATGTLPAGGAGPFGPRLLPPRNYDALIAAAVQEAGGRGLVTELGGPASQYRDKVWSARDAEEAELLRGQSYDEGIDALLAAHQRYAGWDGFLEAVEAATTLPEGVSLRAFVQQPEDYRGRAQVDAAKLLALLDENVIKPVTEAAALLHQGPYLTRLYGRLRAGAEALDPSFVFNADLAQVGNVHIARQHIVCDPTAAGEDSAAWKLELPQGGVVRGKGRSGWPLAPGSLPANLKVVQLSSQGPGTIVRDNSAAIASVVFDAAAATTSPAPLRPPQHGVLIGGSQSVRPDAPIEPRMSRDAGDDGAQDDPEDPARSKRAHNCSLAAQGASPPAVLPLGWALCAWLLGRRRASRGART
jgi:hypothetical protein